MKAYIFLATGFEEVEALATADILKRAGLTVEMVAVMGERMVRGSHDFCIIADRVYHEGEADKLLNDCLDGDIAILPGGMPGTTNLSENKGVIQLFNDYNSKGKWIAAICAAPGVLGMNGLLSGRRATCYPGFEDKLHGAEFVAAPAVISGNVITGRSMGAAIDFGLTIVSALLGEEKAASVEQSLVR